MAKGIQNKMNQRQKRKAENLADRMKQRGVGEDEAVKRAKEQVARQHPYGRGGGANSAGEAKKPSGPRGRRQRTGSDSNASK